MINFNNILILSPHTDDGELGCGGTIAKLVEEGKNVTYMAFSICEESVPDEFPSNILEKEVQIATNELGIPPSNLIIKKYPVRYFFKNRQTILEDMIDVREKLSPDVVFLPSIDSLHQDHSTISIEGLRAFKRSTCLGYDLPWDQIEFHSNCYFILEEKHIHKKINALKCYESQQFRKYVDPEFIRSLARVRGVQINTRFAETFELLRSVYS